MDCPKAENVAVAEESTAISTEKNIAAISTERNIVATEENTAISDKKNIVEAKQIDRDRSEKQGDHLVPGVW